MDDEKNPQGYMQLMYEQSAELDDARRLARVALAARGDAGGQPERVQGGLAAQTTPGFAAGGDPALTARMARAVTADSVTWTPEVSLTQHT